MARGRGSRNDGQGQRERLIIEAEKMISEEGVWALTAGRLASRIGLSRQSVHYHFGTIDDLLIALMRRGMDLGADVLKEAEASTEPLELLWRSIRTMNARPEIFEFRAIAMRSEAVSNEVRRLYEKHRADHIRIIDRHFELKGRKHKIPPAVASMLLPAMINELAFEQSLGMEIGHKEVAEFLEEWMEKFAVGLPQEN